MCSIEEKRYRVPPNFAVRFHPSDVIEIGPGQKVLHNTSSTIFLMNFLVCWDKFLSI